MYDSGEGCGFFHSGSRLIEPYGHNLYSHRSSKISSKSR